MEWQHCYLLPGWARTECDWLSPSSWHFILWWTHQWPSIACVHLGCWGILSAVQCISSDMEDTRTQGRPACFYLTTNNIERLGWSGVDTFHALSVNTAALTVVPHPSRSRWHHSTAWVPLGVEYHLSRDLYYKCTSCGALPRMRGKGPVHTRLVTIMVELGTYLIAMRL